MQLAVGTLIDGKYEITSMLGSGGMGSVYAAKQKDLKRQVAIKILQIPLANHESSKQRFEREAKLLASLEHEHLLKLYAVGFYAELLPYLVTELVDGRTLAQELQKTHRLPLSRVLNIGIQVCQAMEYVHKNKIVHRDLKPQNIMLQSGQQADFAKVLDFGLARIAVSGSGSNTITESGDVVGTPSYLSPEQCIGKRADARSDIYALGCVLYECICGTPPFVGDNAVGVMYLHCNQLLTPPSQLLNDRSLEHTVDMVLLKALQKNPDDRFQSMQEFEDALKKLLYGDSLRITVNLNNAQSSSSSIKSVLAFLLVSLVVFAFVWKFAGRQKHASLPGSPAMTRLEEADKLVNQITGVSGKEAEAKLFRAINLFTQVLSSSTPVQELESREMELMQKLRITKSKFHVTTETDTEINKCLDAAIALQQRKENLYAEGLLSLLKARLTNNHRWYLRSIDRLSAASQMRLANKIFEEEKTVRTWEPVAFRSLCFDIAELFLHSQNAGARKPNYQELIVAAEGLEKIRSDEITAQTQMYLLWELAMLARLNKDFDIEQLCYSKIIAMPDYLYEKRIALLRLANTFEKKGNFEECLRLYEQAVQMGKRENDVPLISTGESGKERMTVLLQDKSGRKAVNTGADTDPLMDMIKSHLN